MARKRLKLADAPWSSAVDAVEDRVMMKKSRWRGTESMSRICRTAIGRMAESRVFMDLRIHGGPHA
jgi:hypothetical protein